MTEWIDITVAIRGGMTGWPGDPPVVVERFFELKKGNDFNATRLCLNTHTGTHMDAPLHFIDDGAGIDEIQLDTVIGPARVIEIENAESIGSEDLEPHDIKDGERILIKTPNSSVPWTEKPFMERYSHLSLTGAAYLAEKRIKLVGIDYLSIAGYAPDAKAAETHRTLLGSDVLIIEGLDLSKVGTGTYELICLPLPIESGDGSPVRAVVKPV